MVLCSRVTYDCVHVCMDVCDVPDVNECEDPLQCPGQECVNSQGSYRCVSCRPGFSLKNGACSGNNPFKTASRSRFCEIRADSRCRKVLSVQISMNAVRRCLLALTDCVKTHSAASGVCAEPATDCRVAPAQVSIHTNHLLS